MKQHFLDLPLWRAGDYAALPALLWCYGCGPDLKENARNAVRYMIDWLASTKGLTRSQAYILCSTAADLKISEVVDMPNFIVSAYLPLQIFADDKTGIS